MSTNSDLTHATASELIQNWEEEKRIKAMKDEEEKNPSSERIESPRPAQEKFYTVNDCVRVYRSDDTGSEHDELVAECRGWKYAQRIAEALNAEKRN